jgi:hypothetical protein
MRAKSLTAIAAISLVGVWVVAGTKPAAGPDEGTDGTSPRNVQLAPAPDRDSAVASALETGQPEVAAPVVRRRQPVPDVAAAEPAHDHAAMIAPEPEPTLSRTAASPEEAPLKLTLASAPSAPIFGAARPIPGATTVPVDYRFPDFGGRAPAVIIRGGMGSGHDDCKIAAPGRMGGSAVNRSAPALGYRGGIR